MKRTVHLSIALVAVNFLTGCLFRTHKVESRVSTAVLKQATKEELVERINTEAQKVQTLNATVDIAPAVGGSKKGKVTEYQEIRGYVLVRKPGMLRMIGLFPIVRNRMFDMVSNGETFKFSLPVKGQFIIGRNDVVHPSHQPLENLRPQHIFDALLLHEIDPANEIPVLETGTEMVLDPKTKRHVEEPTYIINVIRRVDDGNWFLSRKIVFSRQDLLPHRQIVYDKLGNIATDARYEKFTDFGGVSFPASIQITRPQEEYDILLSIVKLRLNEPLKDEQFELQQPPGSQLVRLDVAAAPASEIPAVPAKTNKNKLNADKKPSGGGSE
jgi:outer membrane lipoprotein-sorting protein